MVKREPQFSMRRLLASISVFCVAAAIFKASLFPSDDENLGLFITSTIVFSAGLGILIGRPITFAVVLSLLWAAFIVSIAIMYWGVEM